MGRMKALALAGIVVLSAAPVAHAADLLPPAPQLEPYDDPLESAGWYLRGDVGVGVTMLGKVTSSFNPLNIPPNSSFDQASLGDSAVVGIGLGYKVNNWLRTDITGEYRTAARYSAVESYASTNCGGTRCFGTYGASVGNAVFLANGYFDLGTWANVTPYIGAGVGLADTSIVGLYDLAPSGAFGFAGDSSKWNFAWALMAGLSYAVTPNVSFEFGYRYLDTGSARSRTIVCQNTTPCPNEVQNLRIASQDIKLGMRWLLGEAEASLPPPSLVRKY